MNRKVYFRKGDSVYNGSYHEEDMSILDIPEDSHLVDVTSLTDHEFDIMKTIIPASSPLYDTPPWNSESLINPNVQIRILKKSGLNVITDYDFEVVITPELFNYESEENEIIKNLYYMAMNDYADFSEKQDLLSERLKFLLELSEGLFEDNNLNIDHKTKVKTIEYMFAPVKFYSNLVSSGTLSNHSAYKSIIKESKNRLDNFKEHHSNDTEIDHEHGKRLAKAFHHKVSTLLRMENNNNMGLTA